MACVSVSVNCQDQQHKKLENKELQKNTESGIKKQVLTNISINYWKQCKLIGNA